MAANERERKVAGQEMGKGRGGRGVEENKGKDELQPNPA